MSRDTLPKSVIEALQAAGATEEMISAARVAFVALEKGRRARAAARQKAYRDRKRNITRGPGGDITHDGPRVISRAMKPASKPGNWFSRQPRRSSRRMLPRPSALKPASTPRPDATSRVARLGTEPRRVPLDEARAVAADEFVPLDSRHGVQRVRGVRP
jgi:hypothetical protein